MPAALAPLLATAGVRAVRIPEERGYLSARPQLVEVPSDSCTTTGTVDVTVPLPCPPLPPLPLPLPPLPSAPLPPEEKESKTRMVLCSSCSAAQVLSPPARAVYKAHGFSSSCAFVGCSLCGLETSYSVSNLLEAIDTQIGILRAAATAAKTAEVLESVQSCTSSRDSDNSDTVAALPKGTFGEGPDSHTRSIAGSVPAEPGKVATETPELSPNTVDSVISDTTSFVIECMCHPGWPDALHDGQSPPCWDAFSASGARAQEVAVLSDLLFHEGLAKRNVKLLSHEASGLLDSIPQRGALFL